MWAAWVQSLPGRRGLCPPFTPILHLKAIQIWLFSVKQLCILKEYVLLSISKWEEVGMSVNRICARIVMLFWCPGAFRALAWEKEKADL